MSSFFLILPLKNEDGKLLFEMKKGILIIAMGIFSLSLFGEKIDSIITVLNQKNYKQLEAYLKRAEVSSKKDEFNFNEEISRQIIDSFFEKIINVEEWFPNIKEGSYHGKIYEILILTNGDSIIYAKLVLYPKGPNTNILIQYSDNKLFHQLQKSYSVTYGRKVIIKDFFISYVVYGNRCGRGAVERDYRIRLNKLIESKNIKKLDKWLSSPTAEIQVYAVDGFFQLKEKGYTLTPKELQLINIIKNKKGEIRACSGCIFSSWEITETTEKFKF